MWGLWVSAARASAFKKEQVINNERGHNPKRDVRVKRAELELSVIESQLRLRGPLPGAINLVAS
jgi:hypothetical protein